MVRQSIILQLLVLILLALLDVFLSSVFDFISCRKRESNKLVVENMKEIELSLKTVF